MSMTFARWFGGFAAAATLGTVAAADVPRVATDIAPVHGLVARIMEGIGSPDLVVQRGSSPHAYSMRPSEARALEDADAVFWIGPDLTPWLDGTLDTLASDAEVIELLGTPGITRLEFRDGATFGRHDHADEDHAAHGHEDKPEDEDHAAHGHEDTQEDEDHANHDHDGIDPHAWLDPENGKVWLDVIAEELASLDPGNAETYQSNATAGKKEIDAAVAEARDTLSSVGEVEFVVFHDAYHYFENRFDVPAAGAIAVSDASDPTPARVEEIRDTVSDLGVSCVFSEPQFDQRLVRTVLDGTGGKSGVIDPLGFEIEAGPDFYPALIRSIADEIASCAS